MLKPTSLATNNPSWILKEEKEIFSAQTDLIESQTKWSLQKFDFFFINIGEGMKIFRDARHREREASAGCNFFFQIARMLSYINIFICKEVWFHMKEFSWITTKHSKQISIGIPGTLLLPYLSTGLSFPVHNSQSRKQFSKLESLERTSKAEPCSTLIGF